MTTTHSPPWAFSLPHPHPRASVQLSTELRDMCPSLLGLDTLTSLRAQARRRDGLKALPPPTSPDVPPHIDGSLSSIPVSTSHLNLASRLDHLADLAALRDLATVSRLSTRVRDFVHPHGRAQSERPNIIDSPPNLNISSTHLLPCHSCIFVCRVSACTLLNAGVNLGVEEQRLHAPGEGLGAAEVSDGWGTMLWRVEPRAAILAATRPCTHHTRTCRCGHAACRMQPCTGWTAVDGWPTLDTTHGLVDDGGGRATQWTMEALAQRIGRMANRPERFNHPMTTFDRPRQSSPVSTRAVVQCPLPSCTLHAAAMLDAATLRTGHSPDVEVLVVGDGGHLAAVVVLDVLEVLVVGSLKLVGPGSAADDGGNADVEPGDKSQYANDETRTSPETHEMFFQRLVVSARQSVCGHGRGV